MSILRFSWLITLVDPMRLPDEEIVGCCCGIQERLALTC